MNDESKQQNASTMKITLPDGTTVEGDDMIDVMRVAAAFDNRRVAEKYDVVFEYLADNGASSNEEFYRRLGDLADGCKVAGND